MKDTEGMMADLTNPIQEIHDLCQILLDSRTDKVNGLIGLSNAIGIDLNDAKFFNIISLIISRITNASRLASVTPGVPDSLKNKTENSLGTIAGIFSVQTLVNGNWHSIVNSRITQLTMNNLEFFSHIMQPHFPRTRLAHELRVEFTDKINSARDELLCSDGDALVCETLAACLETIAFGIEKLDFLGVDFVGEQISIIRNEINFFSERANGKTARAISIVASVVMSLGAAIIYSNDLIEASAAHYDRLNRLLLPTHEVPKALPAPSDILSDA